MNTIATLFENILEKPELLIGERSITKLFFFMSGFKFGSQSVQDKIQDETYDGFQSWVENHFEISQSHSWHNTILFMSFCDENRAFERTKELWEKYKTETEQNL
jgi:hypothetical protein